MITISEIEYAQITGYTRLCPKTGLFLAESVKKPWTPELKEVLDCVLNGTSPKWLFSQSHVQKLSRGLAEKSQDHYSQILISNNRRHLLNSLAHNIEYGTALNTVSKNRGWEIQADEVGGWLIWSKVCPIPIWTCNGNWSWLSIKIRSTSQRLTKLQYLEWIKEEIERGITCPPRQWSQKWLRNSEIDRHLSDKALIRLNNMRVAYGIFTDIEVSEPNQKSTESMFVDNKFDELLELIESLQKQVKKEVKEKINANLTEFFLSKIFIEDGNAWLVKGEDVYLAAHGESFNYVGSLYKGWKQNIPDIPDSVNQELAFYF